MNDALSLRWDQSEGRRIALIDRVRLLPAESQVLRPAPKEFAPTEVLEHLALTEAMYLGMIHVSPSAKPSRVNFLYRYTLKKNLAGSRMPTMGSLTPKAIPSVDEAATHWDSVRSSLRGKLEGAEPGKTVVRHPFFGRLSFEDMLTLMDAHCTYHEIRFPVMPD